ncbi:MAG TPA: phosphatidate cytidylyltransferase [Candidatus Hydrogenedentes bacterium]|nr:phosphatidate cytidylyltransferase [Candidatus Hydrogenedentota bacterium]
MDEDTRRRLVDYSQAFANPVVLYVSMAVLALLIITPIIVVILAKTQRISEPHRRELMLRYYSWLVLTPLLLGPILAGALWTILGIGVLSLVCYREYARAVGLFREKLISLIVAIGIVVVTFAVLDKWYAFFNALTPLTISIIAAAAILKDEPKGYIERVALGALGFLLFGSAFGHLGYFANDPHYRGYLILLLLCVELNDVFAYISGKTLGRRKLAPNTSPNKTLGGALGALVLTTFLVIGLGRFVFEGTVLATWPHLVTLGILISIGGQLGDLMLSSIKRDLGIKDMGVSIPGHGGFLDRFDSIILVAPAVFHYVNYFVGIGADPVKRILSGG